MHSVQAYLQSLSTPVPKGALLGWCDGVASYMDSDVRLMLEILRSREALDPETAEAVERRWKAADREKQSIRISECLIDLESFFNV